MRRLALFAALALLPAMLLAAACGNGEADDDGRLRVVATIAPIAALAKEVGGEHIDLAVLVRPGIDPHDYELRIDDRKAIDRARVILRNGVGLDSFLDSSIRGAGKSVQVVTVSEGVRLRESHEVEEEEHSEGDGHNHEGADPHVWQSPQNAMVMVENIARTFAAADPENAAIYEQNATRYTETLRETDEEIRAIIDTIPEEHRKLVANHDAFGYFLDEYGLEFVGAVIPGMSTASEPSAKQIAQLEDTIRHEGVKAIFAEDSVDPRIARQLANDTGVKIVDDLYSDTLGPAGSGADTIHGMLLWNANRIAEALR